MDEVEEVYQMEEMDEVSKLIHHVEKCVNMFPILTSISSISSSK